MAISLKRHHQAPGTTSEEAANLIKKKNTKGRRSRPAATTATETGCSSNDTNSCSNHELPSSWASSTISKVLIFIVVGTALLFATDSLEIKVTSDSSIDASGVALKGNNNQAQHQNATTGNNNGEGSSMTSETLSEGLVVEETGSNSVNNNYHNRRHTYRPRGRPMTDDERQAMINQWGSWTLVDDETSRPTLEEGEQLYYEKYSNRDIPRSEFPSNAWQINPKYLSKFLPEGIALVERAQNAILAEYGQNTTEMFHVEHFDELIEGGDPKSNCNGCGFKGGWTTKQSWEGLKRRMLHAIMTEDNFVFAMGGHSAAAGHGNHFQQSYTLQVQRILEPVFARLGVKHESRNFGNGGLGTIHNTIAAGSIYGPDVDILMWDSGMTEKEGRAKSLFILQALMGGIKLPVIWSLASDVSKIFNLETGIDVGFPGDGSFGIPTATTLEELETIPWAVRYMRCASDINSVCKPNEYNATCWVDRPDFTPPQAQKGFPGGRASWHPGFRKHQITGRVLAFTFLQALKEVLVTWNESENYELSDDAWHMTKYYDDTREKVMTLDADTIQCSSLDNFDLGFLCKYPMKGRTEFTPRAYPAHTNLRNLIPPEQAENIGNPKPPVYNPPDVHNPYLDPPTPNDVDVLSIIEAGVAFSSTTNPNYADDFYKKPTFSKPTHVDEFGRGIAREVPTGDYLCDGSWDSWCGRKENSECLLSGHNDGRHGLFLDSYSGWLVMNIPDLKNGYIVVKIETWHKPNSNWKTEYWNSMNNKLKGVKVDEDTPEEPESNMNNRRELKKKQKVPICSSFKFEYMVDGVLTTLNATEYQQANEHGKVQRVVETFLLLEDPTYTGGEEKEVEVALRIRGCRQRTTFKVTHLYWS